MDVLRFENKDAAEVARVAGHAISVRRGIVYVAIPLTLVLTAVVVTVVAYSKYTRGIYLSLGFLLAADLAIALRGGWRNATTMLASLLLGLAAIELACAALASPQPVYPRGFSVSRPILGWGPSAPGVYRSWEAGPKGGRTYDVNYSIDDHLLRRTLSGPNGPAIAFFGCSFMFGQGLPDSETLPQIYADLAGRKTKVLNFGFPGYAPQQMLRALETGLFDPLLAGAKTFVFETAARHADRAACHASYVTRAPRYELHGDEPVYAGRCAEGLRRVFRDVVVGSAPIIVWSSRSSTLRHRPISTFISRNCAAAPSSPRKNMARGSLCSICPTTAIT